MGFVNLTPPAAAKLVAPADAVCLSLRDPPGKSGSVKNRMLVFHLGKEVLARLGWAPPEGRVLIALGEGVDKGKLRMTKAAPGVAAGFVLKPSKGTGNARVWVTMAQEKMVPAYRAELLRLQTDIIKSTEDRTGLGAVVIYLPKGLLLEGR